MPEIADEKIDSYQFALFARRLEAIVFIAPIIHSVHKIGKNTRASGFGFFTLTPNTKVELVDPPGGVLVVNLNYLAFRR